MTFNLGWVIKEKTDSPLSDDSVTACPYLRKVPHPVSPSLAGRCLAWTGFYSRSSSARAMEKYCKKDFQSCPLYKAAAGGVRGEYQSENVEAWPQFSP